MRPAPVDTRQTSPGTPLALSRSPPRKGIQVASRRCLASIELADLHHRLGATMIDFTHDQVEAMTLADQNVVLNAGRIEQVGTPMDLYDRPETLFVATFIGSPKMNIIQGQAARAENATTIGVRPEHLDVTPDGGWKGTVKTFEHLGNETIAYVDADVGPLTVRLTGPRAFPWRGAGRHAAARLAAPLQRGRAANLNRRCLPASAPSCDRFRSPQVPRPLSLTLDRLDTGFGLLCA